MRALGSLSIVAAVAWSATAAADVASFPGPSPAAQGEASVGGLGDGGAQAAAATRATLTATRASGTPAAREPTSIVLAQAEPAPDDYVPPNHRRPDDPEYGARPKPNPKPWLLTVDASLPFTLGTVSPTLPPVGWGAGLSIARALVNAGHLRLGIGAHFDYQRLQHVKESQVRFGDLTQSLAHTTFAGFLFGDGTWGRFRQWIALGGGFSVAQYFDPDASGTVPDVSATAVVGLLQLEAGLAVEIKRGVEIGLAGHFDLTFSDLERGAPAAPDAMPAPPQYRVFSPGLVSLRLQLGFRF